MNGRDFKSGGKVELRWSSKFAYAIGLIATDGCLSSDGRHIEMTSKDREQLENFMNCLKIRMKIGKKKSGSTNKYCSRVQFGDIQFHTFLRRIGIFPRKSKTLTEIDIPEKYFFDFLRGHFDGDGSFYSYWDKRWKKSFMFYTTLVSASKPHIEWLRREISRSIGIKGHITKAKKSSAYQLKYAKRESLKLIPKLYYDKRVLCLSRKRLKIEAILKGYRQR